MNLSFDNCLKELEKIEQSIDRKYFDNSKLLDKNVGICLIFRNIISNIKLLRNLDNEECDTQPFATLSRMVIDNYAIFYLLTSYSTEKERKLRYYLYLIDSFQSKINSIKDYSESTKHNKLVKKIGTPLKDIAREEQNIKIIKEKIKSEKLNLLFPQKHINKNNWKYDCEKGHLNRGIFSWEELYKIAKIKPHDAKLIQNHYSTFTHGLAMTILSPERNEALIHSIFLSFISIQCYMAKIVIREFNLNVEEINLSKSFIIYMNNY